MQIIEKIKANQLLENPSEIQRICLDKLKLNPIPNHKNELWRLSNKSKFSKCLDFSLNEKISDVVLPYSNNSKNIIRLTFGKNEPINLINNNYFIKQLDKE